MKAAAERRVRIPEGGACLFRGSMWHAGDSYEGEHWRMHFYLLRRQGHEAAEFRNTPGTTDLGLHAVEGIDRGVSDAALDVTKPKEGSGCVRPSGP